MQGQTIIFVLFSYFLSIASAQVSTITRTRPEYSYKCNTAVAASDSSTNVAVQRSTTVYPTIYPGTVNAQRTVTINKLQASYTRVTTTTTYTYVPYTSTSTSTTGTTTTETEVSTQYYKGKRGNFVKCTPYQVIELTPSAYNPTTKTTGTTTTTSTSTVPVPNTLVLLRATYSSETAYTTFTVTETVSRVSSISTTPFSTPTFTTTTTSVSVTTATQIPIVSPGSVCDTSNFYSTDAGNSVAAQVFTSSTLSNIQDATTCCNRCTDADFCVGFQYAEFGALANTCILYSTLIGTCPLTDFKIAGTKSVTNAVRVANAGFTAGQVRCIST